MAKAPKSLDPKKAELAKIQAMSIEKQIDWYMQRSTEIANDPAIKAVLDQIDLLNSVKTGLTAQVNKDPKWKDTPKTEGVTYEGQYAVLKFTKCPESQALVLSVEDTIKELGLETCLPAISLSASKLADELGNSGAKKYIKKDFADRRFQSITLK